MRRRSRVSIALAVVASACGLGLVFVGCDAGGGAGGSLLQNGDGPSGAGGEGGGVGGRDGAGGTGESTTLGITVGGGGNDSASTSTGYVNPCGTECGPVELCDGAHKGIDDDCDGSVDEDCPCSIGQATDCFKGDPSYRTAPGCFPGSQQCTEFGTWGACQGGAHASDDPPCFEGSLDGCHAITSVPFQTIDLKTGTGIFSNGSDPETETFTVECPIGIDPCPAPNGSMYQALQSGEYTVTYTKLVDGAPEVCSYPLNVGARGLRVELSWNFAAGTDFDLHMMQPAVNTMFDSSGSVSDCTWDNCRIDNGFPEWFPASAPVGDPVAWYLDPLPDLNSCYFAPRGYGDEWSSRGQGCHNPRLDLDNIYCDTSETDPQSSSFCAAENVNIDFPPNDQWIRLGLVHYSGSTNQPTMKIFCDGALKAVLGPEGFGSPVILNEGGFQQNVWIAADVAFVADECGAECVVKPVYRDEVAQTPFVAPAPAAGPPFPPLPVPGE